MIKCKYMGMTNVRLTISNPTKPSKKVEGNFWVDSGAVYTVLPDTMVKKLTLKPSFQQEFSLADGTIVKRSIGSAAITYEGRQLAVPVVLGEKGDNPLLGATALESFGLVLDPFKQKLHSRKLLML